MGGAGAQVSVTTALTMMVGRKSMLKRAFFSRTAKRAGVRA
jgi:hypothetical protein